MAIEVATLEDLNNVRNNLSGEYIQTADIDASPTSDPENPYYNSGAGWEPIGNSSTAFTGTYDGGGHSVDGLFINRGSLIGVGLFGYTNAATVQNLAVTNANVTGQQRVGALIGNADTSTTITGCSSTGAVDSAYTNIVRIGGLVGNLQSAGTTCTDCWSSVTVSGRRVGGLIGQMWDGSSALRCYATGDVTGIDAGGFVGYMYNATISNCYTGHGNTVTDTGVSYGGGFAGYATSGNTLRDCYCATIDVDCQHAFSGANIGTHIDCFYDSDLANKTQSNVTGKTTAEMKALATFSSAWSIARVGDWVDETWVIGDSDGDMYPELYEFYQPSSDISYTADVDLFDFHITSYSDSLLYTRNSLSYNTDIDIVQDTLYTADVLLSKHWRVKGTGDSSFDGIYTEEGEVNGQVYYTYGEGVDKRYLYFDPPSWGLTKDSEFTASKKEYIDHDKLPGNPWSPINDGVEPAPTVAELQEDKYYSNILLYERKDAVYNSNIIILKTENTTLLSDISVKDTYSSSFSTDVFLKAIVTVSYAPASANGNSSNQQMMFF